MTLLQAWLKAEYLALWDTASAATHTNAAVNAPWLKVLNGPNDAVIYARGDLGLPDIADRLLRVRAAISQAHHVQ